MTFTSPENCCTGWYDKSDLCVRLAIGNIFPESLGMQAILVMFWNLIKFPILFIRQPGTRDAQNARQGPCALATLIQLFLKLGPNPDWGPPAQETLSLKLVLTTSQKCLGWMAFPSGVLESRSYFRLNSHVDAGSATYLPCNLKQFT